MDLQLKTLWFLFLALKFFCLGFVSLCRFWSVNCGNTDPVWGKSLRWLCRGIKTLPEYSNCVGNNLLNVPVVVWVALAVGYFGYFVDISVLFPGVVLCHYHVVNTQKQPQSNSSLKGNFYGSLSLNFLLEMLKELRIEVPLRKYLFIF